MLKHRIIVRIERPYLRVSRVACSKMQKVSMKEAAKVVLCAVMLMNVRLRSL